MQAEETMKIGSDFRSPRKLEVSNLMIGRFLVVGSCAVAHFPGFVYDQDKIHVDYVLFNNVGEVPSLSVEQIEEYSFQLVQLPLRSVIPDLFFDSIDADAPSKYDDLMRAANERLGALLGAACVHNAEHGLLTFVTNFFVPQQNGLGKLIYKYNLSNRSYFIECLNRHLAELVDQMANAFLIDVDGITASFGKRYFLDDFMWADNHGSLLNDWDYMQDSNRIAPSPKPSAIYGFEDYPAKFMNYLWLEIKSMYRTARGIDQVKLVIFDLDDTLWRGVIADKANYDGTELEGWPLGIFDSLRILRERGIIIALASKNDSNAISIIWEEVVGRRFALDNFAVRAINWNSKPDNVRNILSLTNILPQNTLFVDDNPREREAIRAEFPAMRIIGGDHYELKRDLLWSPELQTANITVESSGRNEMISRQIVLKENAKKMDREDFLKSLEIKIVFGLIDQTANPDFSRFFELLNKTNQFNTTGIRWTFEKINSFFKEGGRVWTWRVSDKYSEYGLVGAAIVNKCLIQQFVMSCRVFGMDIESSALKFIESELRKGGFRKAEASLLYTDKNNPCQDFYRLNNYINTKDVWWKQI